MGGRENDGQPNPRAGVASGHRRERALRRCSETGVGLREGDAGLQCASNIRERAPRRYSETGVGLREGDAGLRCARRNRERGAVLGLVVIATIVFSVVASAMMTISLGRMKSSGEGRDRLMARYAAEAGLVFAMTYLWVDPDYCGVPDPPAINGMTVDVVVSNCGGANDHRIDATVQF